MKKFIGGASLALALFSSSLTYAETKLLDKVVAIVDDDVVLASEFNNRIATALNNLKKAGQPTPPMDELRQQLLDIMILDSLQMQLARRAGVRISDEQLNSTLSRIAAQNRMSLSDFKQTLENEGQSYHAMREQIRQELTLQQVQAGNINRRVNVTEQEVINFLNSEEGKSTIAPEYHLLHTLIPLSSGAREEQISAAKNYAEQTFQKIQNGLAHSNAFEQGNVFRANTQDLGWRKVVDLPSLASDVAATLTVNETAAPIRNSSGFHLLTLIEKRGIDIMVSQTRTRHILVKPTAISDDQQTKTFVNELRQRIINGEDFADLAREHSDDIGSAREGGDLNWVTPGQMVPEFDAMIKETETGTVSPAFRTNFGWHILEVTDRREHDMTTIARQRMARNFLHDRKFEDEKQAWLQKVRDEAYVDVK